MPRPTEWKLKGMCNCRRQGAASNHIHDPGDEGEYDEIRKRYNHAADAGEHEA
jgi:hypothetical protein